MTAPQSLAVTFGFTLAEYATLVRIVDEGMWEIVSAPRQARDAALQDRVCELIGLPGYTGSAAVAGVLEARRDWPASASDRVHTLMGQVAAKEIECQRLREQQALGQATLRILQAIVITVERDELRKLLGANLMDAIDGVVTSATGAMPS